MAARPCVRQAYGAPYPIAVCVSQLVGQNHRSRLHSGSSRGIFTRSVGLLVWRAMQWPHLVRELPPPGVRTTGLCTPRSRLTSSYARCVRSYAAFRFRHMSSFATLITFESTEKCNIRHICCKGSSRGGGTLQTKRRHPLRPIVYRTGVYRETWFDGRFPFGRGSSFTTLDLLVLEAGLRNIISYLALRIEVSAGTN